MKRFNLLLTLGLGALLAWPGLQPAFAADTKPRDETQLWDDVNVTFSLRPNVDLALIGGLRFGQGLSRPVNERAGASVSFKLGRFFSVSPSYQYIGLQPLPGSSNHENRFTLEGTFRFPYRKFLMSDRNRIERRLLPSGNSFRYRNRFQIERVVGHNGNQVRLFISDEVFYDGLLNTWSRNRFAVGGGKQVSRRIIVEVYYLRQNDHYSHPGDIHALGTTLRLRGR